jgi:enamine deaminase RidA (YjgF/YER057c/UK114 family)
MHFVCVINRTEKPGHTAPVAIERLPSESSFSDEIGFSATVSADSWVHVAGISAVTEDGAIVGGDDAYDQAVEVLAKLERALEQAGARLDQVVKTTMYITEREDWDRVGRAHAEAFGDAPPAASMVVAELLDPRMLVELEAVAFTGA